MRTRTRVLGAVALVTLVATASSTLAVRREASADRAARAAALDAVQLALVDAGNPALSSLITLDDTAFRTGLFNRGPDPVEVLSAGWVGGVREPVNTLLVPGLAVRLSPDPGPCPTRRWTTGFDAVEVEIAVPGASRVLRLPLQDPRAVREDLNLRCRLFAAGSSLGTSYQVGRERAGDVSLRFVLTRSSRQRLELVGVTSGPGVTVTTSTLLPLDVPAEGGRPVTTFTDGVNLVLDLRRTDCAALERSPREVMATTGGTEPPAPTWRELQLQVRHPGEPVETQLLYLSPNVVNALSRGCDVPVVENEYG